MINVNPLALLSVFLVIVIFIVFGVMYFDIKELRYQKQVLMNQITQQNNSIQKYKQESLDAQKKVEDYVRHSKELIRLNNEKVNQIMKEKIPNNEAIDWARDQAELFK